MRTKYTWNFASSFLALKIVQFLPVIGRLIADLVEDKLGAELTAKFSIDRKITQADHSRSGQDQALDLTELNTPEDLQFRPIS